MSKQKELKTKVNKCAVAFTLTGLVASIAVITLVILFALDNVFGIVAMFFFIIIGVAAIITLLGLLLDYCYISNGTLFMQYVFKSSHIKLSDIGDLELKDNVYTVYDKSHNKIGTINSLNIGADRIISALDKAGAKLK